METYCSFSLEFELNFKPILINFTFQNNVSLTHVLYTFNKLCHKLAVEQWRKASENFGAEVIIADV
jgi:hypothetical protein